MKDIAALLRAAYPARAPRIPRREFPDPLFRLIALFDRSARTIVGSLGRDGRATADKARAVLGWAPRPVKETVLDTAESLIRLGLV